MMGSGRLRWFVWSLEFRDPCSIRFARLGVCARFYRIELHISQHTMREIGRMSISQTFELVAEAVQVEASGPWLCYGQLHLPCVSCTKGARGLFNFLHLPSPPHCGLAC